MNKIKYQGGITKLICQKSADWQREKFHKQLLSDSNFLKVNQSKEVSFEVLSFSGAANFDDQILSIYSFVFYAGIPIRWTIYSDNSYTAVQIDLIQNKFPFVTVKEWDVYPIYKENDSVKAYLLVCALAKKLNIILGHSSPNQLIYIDSDIIFYKNITYYLNSSLLKNGFWYVPDTFGNIDKYFQTHHNHIYALNSGLIIFNNTFNKEDIFKYLKNLGSNYEYFSEQSSFEYAFRKQGGNVLDPRQFIIDSSDQFDFATKYAPDEIAMRHYTSPVRHKIWQQGWKWHFRN